jgi:MarR family multiple gene transcriptional regulator MgrA
MDSSHYRTARQIVQLGNIITWLHNQKMQSKGLTSSQSDIIRYLLHHQDEEVTAGNLMEKLGLSQSTIAGLLKRLEEKELISRYTDGSDGRRSVIQLTSEGLALEEYLQGIAMQTGNIMLNGMSDEEQNEFSRLLHTALTNMNAVRGLN